MSVQLTLGGIPVRQAHRFSCSRGTAFKTPQGLSSHLRWVHGHELAQEFEGPPGSLIGKMLKRDVPEEAPEVVLSFRVLSVLTISDFRK